MSKNRFPQMRKISDMITSPNWRLKKAQVDDDGDYNDDNYGDGDDYDDDDVQDQEEPRLNRRGLQADGSDLGTLDPTASDQVSYFGPGILYLTRYLISDQVSYIGPGILYRTRNIVSDQEYCIRKGILYRTRYITYIRSGILYRKGILYRTRYLASIQVSCI